MINRVGIRDTLNKLYAKKYGFTNDDISMDNNRNVTIKGQKLMQVSPASIIDGRSYGLKSSIDRSINNLATSQGWGQQAQNLTQPPVQDAKQPMTAGQALANNSMNTKGGFNSLITDEKLDSMLNNILNFKYDANNDPSYQVAKQEGQKLFKDQMGDYSAMTMGNPSSWGMAAATQSQNEYDQRAYAQGEQNARNMAIDNFKTAYGLRRDNIADQRYADELAYKRGRDERADYIESIQGLGSSIDASGGYQQMYNDVTNDNDPTNDWKGNYIMQERQKKLDANKQKEDASQEKEIARVGQYYDNFQQEIDNRTNTPDTADDFLIPYLKIARQQKIEGKKKEDIAADDRLFERDYKNRQLKQQDRQLDISQQNANRLSTKESDKDSDLSMDEYFAQDFKKYGGEQGSGITVKQAIAALTKDKTALIGFYGEDGYRKLWNSVLSRAINKRQADALTSTPKAPTDDDILKDYLK